MQIHHYLAHPSLLIAILLIVATDLPAQTFGDDDNLFIPPSITVGTPHAEGKPMIDIRERHTPQWSPLIPVLFFDNPGDWMIPERYQRFGSAPETREYADSSGVETGSGERAKYYEILNVLGNRLLRYPDAVLTLRGCHSFEAGETPEVAHERALVVREYLVKIWGVDTARLPLVSVASRADTFASNPLQAEARRVEFASTTQELLDPVRYREIGIEAETTALRIVVVPNMEPQKVDSIELMMLDDMGDLQDASSIPGHPDSTNYVLDAFWTQEKSRGEDGMTLLCRVHSTDGKIRPSNSVFLPVRITQEEERDPYWDHKFLTVPFLSFGNPEPGPAEMRMARSAVDFFERGIRPKHRDGYVLYGWGRVDLVEHPSLNAVEVNVEVDSRRAEIEGIDPWRSAGKLRIMTVVTFQRNGTEVRAYVDSRSTEEQEEVSRKFIEKREDHVARLTDDPSMALADSLAKHRAARLVGWMKDSLDIPMINDELPEKIGQLTSRFYGLKNDSEQESSVAAGTTAMRNGIRYSGEEGTTVALKPEERWYARGVMLEFWTREYLDIIMLMSGIDRE